MTVDNQERETMTTYLAFLRGINVGGNSLIRMAELTKALEAAGLQGVKTYIQSGNVIFVSAEKDKTKLAALIKSTIHNAFNMIVDIAVFTQEEWRTIIKVAPSWWGDNQDWKHNLLIMIEPYDMQETIAFIGELKPDIEALQAGNGVLYQSLSFERFSRTAGGKLASKPIYKQMTVRNYNTATKLLGVLDKLESAKDLQK
jgi:uncharacterized protein (DUF1697 family)